MSSRKAKKDVPPPPSPEAPSVPRDIPLGEWMNVMNKAIAARDGSEPEWAALVRENHAPSTVGPPPIDIPAEVVERLNLEKPFVRLTLIETGEYVGPTRGRVTVVDVTGFQFLTHDGLFFIPWSNLAYWRYLPELD